MYSDWYREHNYYQKIRFCDEYPTKLPITTHQVYFKNSAFPNCITYINVMRWSNQEIKVYINISVFHQKEVRDIIVDFFGPFYKGQFFNEHEALISFTPEDDIKLLVSAFENLFNHFNKKFERTEFPNILLRELESIFTWSTMIAKQSASSALYSPMHLIKEYIDPFWAEPHINPLKEKSTTAIALFNDRPSSYIKTNLLKLRKKIRYLLSYDGEDPNQVNRDGETLFYYIILYFPPEDLAYLLWRKADPRYRPKGGKGHIYYNAIELAKRFNRPEALELIGNASPERFQSPELQNQKFQNPNGPRLILQSCQVKILGNQILSKMVFPNNCIVRTKFLTIEEFYKYETNSTKDTLFELFATYNPDPNGDIKKTRKDFDNEFSIVPNKNLDLVFDNTRKLVGYFIIVGEDDDESIGIKFHNVGLSKECILRGCGGVGLFGIRWAILIKSLYRAYILRTYQVSTHYNSYAPTQDELNTPRCLAKPMRDFNQRMVNRDFKRPIHIYYDRFIAIPELIKIADKKDPNKKKSFDESCYNQFVLSFDDPADEKALKKTHGEVPTQASVVSSVVGRGYLERRAKVFRHFINIDLNRHVYDLSCAMNSIKNQAKHFFPMLERFKQSEFSLDFEDERASYWNGVQDRAKL